MGWYALIEGGEDLGDTDQMSSSMKINNPCNKTCFSFHLGMTTYQHGKNELNLRKLIYIFLMTRTMKWNAFLSYRRLKKQNNNYRCVQEVVYGDLSKNEP